VAEGTEKTIHKSDATGLSGLQAMVGRAAPGDRGAAPVEKWHPDFCGDIDMEIRADGSWYYMGTPIGRKELVKLFASVLRKDEDDKTYLVTPVEKIGIKVEDAHFLAVEMNCHERDGGPVLTFRTNVDDIVEAGEQHPLRFQMEPTTGGLKPYLHIRGRLQALLARPVMYELISHGEEIQVDGRLMFAVRSGGDVFPIMPAEELSRLSA